MLAITERDVAPSAPYCALLYAAPMRRECIDILNVEAL
jgi:hypothetical protein